MFERYFENLEDGLLPRKTTEKEVNASEVKYENKNDAFKNFSLNHNSSTKELNNNDLKSTSITLQYLYENKLNNDWISNRPLKKPKENAQFIDNTGKVILKNLISPPNSSNIKQLEFSSKKPFDNKNLRNGVKFLFP